MTKDEKLKRRDDFLRIARIVIDGNQALRTNNLKFMAALDNEISNFIVLYGSDNKLSETLFKTLERLKKAQVQLTKAINVVFDEFEKQSEKVRVDKTNEILDAIDPKE